MGQNLSLGVDNSPQLIAAYQVILIVGECVDESSECRGWSEENSCLTQLPVWRPSCSAPASEQQVVRMDTVRYLSSALWILRTSQEAARLLRTSLSLLRCFLFFDICYLIGGITLISMALSNQVNDQENRMVFAGGLLTLLEASQQCVIAWPVMGSVPGAERFCCRGFYFSSSSLLFFSSTSPRCSTSTCSCSWPPTASSPAGATSTSSTWSWPSLAQSRSSSTSSRWCATTSDPPPPTRPLVTCLPSMRRCRQLHLRLLKRRPPHRSTTSP